jgi:branched-chain amino acid transport system permease protein
VEVVPQIVVSGLAQGSIYALAALGIIVIFNATQIVNFAQGAMGVAAAYVAWFAMTALHLPFFFALATAVAFAFALGVVVEALLLRRLQNASTMTQMVVTLGLFMAILGTVGVLCGYNPRAFPELWSQRSFELGAVIVRPQDTLNFALLGGLAGALALLFRRTKLGLAMRAITQDAFAARLMGVSLRRTLSLAWGIGVALAGVTAILAAPVTTLTPGMMDSILIYGFVAAIVGGFGTFSGAITGGLAVGVVDNVVKTFLAPELSLTIVFGLLLLVLYVRPNGFFGRELAQKV